jgi:hypothetical protein
MPGGVPIGKAGTGRDIREVPGGAEAAEALFDCLRVEGSIHRSDPNMTIVSLPRRTGYMTFRRVSSSGDPAIDVNVPGVRLKIHFPSGGKHGH